VAIFAPLFARGKANQKVITTLAQGSNVVTLSAPAAPIAVGMHVFVSDASFVNCEYLGKAKAVSGSQVTTQYPAQAAHAGGSLWTPSSSWQSTLPSAANEPSLEPGIVTVATSEGLVHTRTSADLKYVELVWANADRSDRAAYNAWHEAQTDNGLKSFTAAWVDRDTGAVACAKVKLRAPGQSWKANETAFVLRTWPCELQVVERGTYL